ncbi:MAG: hypothetical protein GY850_11550 [bacterium]|nr:hypothetical protein [bacterium]
MDVENSFNIQIGKINRRIVIQAIFRVLLHVSLIFFGISTVFLILPIAGFTNYHFKGGWVFVSIGLSLSAALFIAFGTRSNLLNVFIEIDHRLGLQDRLSTAYEYLKSGKKTEFADLLMNDAAARLQRFSLGQLVPARFSRLYALAIILLIINVLLYSGIFPAPEYKSTGRDLAKIENAGKILQKYMIGRVDDQADRQSKPQSEYARKLKQLSNRLNDSKKPARQRFAALKSFLKEVQGEQARLANELGARLDSADIKDLPVQKIPEPANLSSNQLEKLKAILNKMLNNRIPDSISQKIESLRELDGMEKLLARIIDDLNIDGPVADDPAAAADTKGQSSQSTGDSDNPSDDPTPANSIRQYSDPSGSTENRTDHPGSAKSGPEDDNPADGMNEPGGKSTSAGRAKSNTESRSDYQIEKSPGAATQDQLASARAKSYLIHIRALTDIGEARLKEEEIFQTYRGEVESILQKEEMPQNYREYIKNYFISVGIHTEDKAHESK